LSKSPRNGVSLSAGNASKGAQLQAMIAWLAFALSAGVVLALAWWPF
jgi:hypothetical protein